MTRARTASASAITIAVVAILFVAAQRVYRREPVPSAQPHTVIPGAKITLPGTYEFQNLHLTLRVWTDRQNLIQYELRELSGTVLAHSTEQAIALSRWAITVDESRRLWFYSGDVGFFLWDGGHEGVSRPIHDDPAARSAVPAEMREYLR